MNEYYEEPKKTDGISVASLVCGIVSFCCCNPLYLVSVAAIILGIVGIAKNGGSKGMAIAGLILGGLAILAGIILDIILLPITFGTSFFF